MLPGSFVISLAITLAVTKLPVSGFTIRRSQNISDSKPDMETAESTQLEVRHGLQALPDHNDIDVSRTTGGLDSTVIAINDPKNVDKKHHNYENITATLAPSINETTDIKTQIPRDRELKNLFDISKLMLTETFNISYTTSAPSTSQTTTRGPEKRQDFTTKSILETLVAIENQILNLDEFSSNPVENSSSTIKEKEAKSTETTTSESNTVSTNQNFKEEFYSTENQDTVSTTTNLIESVTNKSDDKIYNTTTADSYAARKELGPSISVTNNKNHTTADKDSQWFTVDVLKESNKTNSTMNNDEGSSIIMTDEFIYASTTTSPESDLDTTTIILELPTTEVDVTTLLFNTETLSTDYNPPTSPPWKKYITIDRRRVSTEGSTISDKDMVKAETSQSRILLENVLSSTPIPSLEKLRNDLINAQELTTSKFETTDATEAIESSTTEVETSTFTQKMEVEIETKMTKMEIVSKRAGYIDNKETTIYKTEKATTSDLPSKVSVNDTEIFSSMYETEPGDVDVPDNKNTTGFESQSQLAEDAIKEELLREEMLNDNEENAKRHRDERLILAKVKQLDEWKTIGDIATVREIVTEDMLSVKPISPDKKKSGALYAVNPNYKPLKKIEVQPPKQFVRNPDDNSWRNESISSLGIVFNPNNASKSFTEVIKNKTEVVLSNMTEKNSKGDVPDLRVRLEKIAEVRKSKKKKINKFGDTVYSDYEESGENFNSPKEDITSPMSPLAETMVYSAAPPSNSSPTKYDLTINAISREKFDFYKNEGTTSLTTDKPKKFDNVAEYYDTPDEYDADYVKLAKIDLKKFTQPFKARVTQPATQIPELLHTKPTREYQPERIATVQYFPPIQKVTQKVNLNDYDTGFNRKVNLYTIKDPKNLLSVSYGTISPIQTEKFQPINNKPTVKPSFTPITHIKTDILDKNLYLTKLPPRVTKPPISFEVNDGSFNRASYVIKHYRDFINEAAKESDDDRNTDFLQYTESPLQGVTINDLVKMTTPRESNPSEEEYDYDVKFRKDILDRFLDNFNENSERFKVDFPILYNSSVVHRQRPENGNVLASSSAFMKRLYEAGNPRPSSFLSNTKSCDPHCDNNTVELSPAYELHYYVPDQEEKEEVEPRPLTVPNRYRL